MPMSSDEIRETFLSFFEGADHRRLPSARSCPPTTTRRCCSRPRACTRSSPTSSGRRRRRTAGSPAARSASARPTSRTSATPRATCTFFEMLGNFSLGDYFKQGADRVRVGALDWRASASTPEDIWITVFEGDDELGLGPTRRRSRPGQSVGVPRERIVAVPRAGELLAGRARPVPAARARSSTSTGGWSSARPTTCPAATTSASSSTGTSSSCSSTRTRSTRSRRCPAQNIDTGLGLNRMAAILQGVDVGLRDRPVQAADRAGRGAVGPPLRRGLRRPTARCGSSPTTRAR